MKIGVDAVILGAWAAIAGARNILDAGCGCGVISLMCAQRNPFAHILAIDIDNGSVEEAAENFKMSPWSERLDVEEIDFNSLVSSHIHSEETKVFDYIISNPPYFDAGVENPSGARMQARHQDGLSPAVLLGKCNGLLSEDGILGMVVPLEQCDDLRRVASENGLCIYRKLIMTGREGRKPKRIFIELKKTGTEVKVNPESKDLNGDEKIGTLIIEHADGSFTKEYISLCKDFYLKF